MATHPPSGGADESQLDQKIDEQSDTLVAETKELAEEMHQRCRVLLDELLQFQAHLKALKKEARVEVRCFKGGVQSELRILGKVKKSNISGIGVRGANQISKLLKSDPANPKTAHGLRSSNLSFYWLVWSIAKTCRSVIGLEKKFFKIHAKADIISEDGLSWTMVSSVTEKKIIWDLAKAGWVDSSGESEDDFELLEDDKPEGLLRQVEALLKASRATVVHGRHPKITLVLPKIKAIPDSKEVGAILQKIRNMGVAILTSQELPTGPPLPADAIEQMAADRLNCFSDTLNIDCTILLAFASDLSHGRVEPAQWHNRAIARQIELEAEDLLLPSSLWPACGSRKLVTTREAADRMREIIKTIGSEDESKRASLLLGLDENSHLPQEQLVKHFQTLTDYPVPAEWSLPIKIIDTDMAAITSSLPAFAENVAEKLTPINRSVFFYGWANRMTILSSNAGVAKVFDHAVEQSSDPDSAGPDIWLSPTCRSLVGKEKKRRGFTEREEGTL